MLENTPNPSPEKASGQDSGQAPSNPQTTFRAVVLLLHSILARELGPDGVAPDWWGDDEFKAFLTLQAAVSR